MTTEKLAPPPTSRTGIGAASFFIPGLGQLLLGYRWLGVQFLVAAALVWTIALPTLQGTSLLSQALAAVALLALHLGAGMTALADARRHLSAESSYGAQLVYRRWSVIVAGAVVLFIAGLLAVWIVTLPSWALVQRNFLFLLIGRFRAEQFAGELWRLWGFAALTAGGLISFGLAQIRLTGKVGKGVRFSGLPLLLGVVVAVVMLFPTINPEVQIGGLALSLILALLGILGAIPLGLLFGVGRINTLPVMRGISTVYVELFRSLPFITVIFWFFIFVPYVLGQGTQFWAIVLALSLFTGAYVAEIVRAGVQALPSGQAEAARALGLSGTQTMVQVVLPQAVRNMIPPLVGQFISLFKDTSLVSIVGLIELAGAGRITANRLVTATFELYLTVALLYFIFAYLLSLLARRLEAPSASR